VLDTNKRIKSEYVIFYFFQKSEVDVEMKLSLE